MTPITIPLPAELQSHIHNMEKENFCLWMFISQNDLWEEAQEFLSCNYSEVGKKVMVKTEKKIMQRS